MATGTVDFAYAKGAFQNTIRFEIGSSKEPYYIHEKPAAECSGYIWSALHPAWRTDSQDLVITGPVNVDTSLSSYKQLVDRTVNRQSVWLKI